MRLTQRELDEMPAKTKRYPEVLQLYFDHDFLEAYALHTDQRIRNDGAKAAVGSGDNWDVHGQMQLDFLVARGLRPQHRLLEIGCGTGRLARKAVPYLDTGHYTGYDISTGALDAARALASEEGWDEKLPEFMLGHVPPTGPLFDFAWAFSVFIHLPTDVCIDVMRRVDERLRDGGQFFFSYVPEERAWRSGVKQFRHTLEDYREMSAVAGFATWEDVPNWIQSAGHVPGRWSGGQRVACTRAVW